ncbi:MAG: 4Fe-4S dicluster domain-containing protein [Candidatus Buchananbacteria bacterium]|jgi:ferredoxin
MKQNAINKLRQFAAALMEEYFVYAPIMHDEKLTVMEAENCKDIDWSGQITHNPWKEMFTPHTERLFDLENGKVTATKGVQPLVACLGMNILDLKALALYDTVFANDIYYQNRRNHIAIIGFSSDWPNDYKKFKVFSHNFEQDILKHVRFDIFIAKLKSGLLKFYSGSQKGSELLEKYGINKFDHIEFEGAVPEKGADKRMISLTDKVEKSFDHSLWNTLNDICLACGKCTIACPTCFCFNFVDRVDPENSRRDRVQGNCFYNDFSKVAGGHKELDTVKKKIYFWYVHKFVRIPKEYKLPGCVSCGRCVKVCPVGIDIFKNIAKLEKIKFDVKK